VKPWTDTAACRSRAHCAACLAGQWHGLAACPHGITADIELIAADAVNAAYERMLRSDVRYRFVIDASTISAPA
jgi:hypothetical protein